MVKKNKLIAQGASNITKWIGSSNSVILHSLLFVVSFILPYTGLVSYERMLLFLTTIVSLEAIYLSIFIQMSINMNNQNIEVIHGTIEEIGEDIEDIGESIDEINENVEEMNEEEEETEEDNQVLLSIQQTLVSLQKEIEILKRNTRKSPKKLIPKVRGEQK